MLRDLWTLDPEITFLNHGSFGACPIAVLEVQRELRERMERQPVRFLARELPGLLDDARAVLGAFIGADGEDLAFVPNATSAVNTVLRSLRLERGDELLTTDHAYGACRNALHFVARLTGARVIVARVPFPIARAEQVVDAVLESAGPRTRLALVDHVTSPTGLVFPVERLVAALHERGIEVLVDGAHAPGMVALDVAAIGASYYVGNCHKWLCAPKGAAFLWVRRDRQAAIHPLVVSHGATARSRDRSRFRLEFDWTGTDDPTAYLAVPAAIRVMGALLPGGWPDLMARNRSLALGARRSVCDALGIPPPSPDTMIGSLAAMPLPGVTSEAAAEDADPLQVELLERHRIEVPVIAWPPRRLLRVSAQLYNALEEYDRLARALVSLVPGCRAADLE